MQKKVNNLSDIFLIKIPESDEIITNNDNKTFFETCKIVGSFNGIL